MAYPNEILKNNKYPGRGIIIGITQNGKHAAIAYFIMGRSENSRNRVFSLDGDNLKTEPFDLKKVVDPSLIIYNPVKSLGGITIVTNGDQTDTIYDYIRDGKTFEDALRTRTFEPDKPNFTPRISAILNLNDTGIEYKMSIIKSFSKIHNAVHQFFEYRDPVAGLGHLIHTYKEDGNPIPSFEGEPKVVEIENSLKSFGDNIWEALDEENKISLFTRFIDIRTGEHRTRIINKNY